MLVCNLSNTSATSALTVTQVPSILLSAPGLTSSTFKVTYLVLTSAGLRQLATEANHLLDLF